MSADQFLVTLASSCPFAFAAGPMIAEALVLGPKDFEGFLEGCRKELPVFLKRALQR